MNDTQELLDLCEKYCNLGQGLRSDITKMADGAPLHNIGLYSLEGGLAFFLDLDTLTSDDSASVLVDEITEYLELH